MGIAPSLEARSARPFARMKILLERGIRVALGHDTSCSVEEVVGALKVAGEHGARPHITHAFNVQRFHHRDCGLANVAILPKAPCIAALANVELPSVEVIGDCVHASPLILQLVASSK